MADVKLRYNKASAQYFTVDDSYDLLQKMGCDFSKHQLRKLVAEKISNNESDNCKNTVENCLNVIVLGVKAKIQLSSLLKYLKIEYEEIGEIDVPIF